MFQGLAGKAKIRRPQVDFAGAKLSGLSFDAVDLMFDLRIRNPNSLGLKMAGFDYDFLINGTSFLKGNQEERLEIQARGESMIHFPLSLRFVDLYQTFQNLLDQDVSTYQLDCGFSFDVPVLGLVKVPVSKKGEFPLLKIPTVDLDALKLKNLTLSGAELQLGVRVNNPNAFSMILEHLQYRFEVNGLNWISGDARESTEVTERGEGIIEIPIYLDFFQMGRSVYQLLAGDANVSYEFGGRLDLATSVPLLDQVSLPFDRSGKIKVLR
jgi:LEA14-like dessication related protein